MHNHDDSTGRSGSDAAPDFAPSGCEWKIAKLKLPAANRSRVEEVIEDAPIPCQPGPERDSALLNAARAAAGCFPQELAEALGNLAAHGTTTHAVLVDNLPVDPVVAGPDGRCRKPGHKSDVSVLAVVLACGVQPFQYLQESDAGQLIKAITPDPERSAVPFNGGRVALGMHTDNPFLGPDFWPEMMALCCSQNAPETATKLARLEDVRDALARQDSAMLERLFRADFCHRAPNSFALQGQRIYGECVPVIARRNGRLEIGAGLYDGITAGRNSESNAALAALATAALNVATDVVLRVGQVLVWDNQTVLHGRGWIEDSGPRYLQRVFVRRSLDGLHRAAPDAITNVFDCLDIVPHIGPPMQHLAASDGTRNDPGIK